VPPLRGRCLRVACRSIGRRSSLRQIRPDRRALSAVRVRTSSAVSATSVAAARATWTYRHDGLRHARIAPTQTYVTYHDAQEDLLSREVGNLPSGGAANRAYHLDALGSVGAVTDASQSTVVRYQTDAWGNVLTGAATDDAAVYLGGLGLLVRRGPRALLREGALAEPGDGAVAERGPGRERAAVQLRCQPARSENRSERDAVSPSDPRYGVPSEGAYVRGFEPDAKTVEWSAHAGSEGYRCQVRHVHRSLSTPVAPARHWAVPIQYPARESGRDVRLQALGRRPCKASLWAS